MKWENIGMEGIEIDVSKWIKEIREMDTETKARLLANLDKILDSIAAEERVDE